MEDLKVLSTDPLCPLVQGIQQIPSWLRLSTSHLMWRLMICLPALLQIQPKLILWTGLRRCSVNIWRVATISLLCQDHRTSTFPQVDMEGVERGFNIMEQMIQPQDTAKELHRIVSNQEVLQNFFSLGSTAKDQPQGTYLCWRGKLCKMYYLALGSVR